MNKCLALRIHGGRVPDYFVKIIYAADHCHDNHHARATVEYLRQVTPEFILPDLWSPNSPDLNPVDHRVWGCTRVYRQRDTGELKQRLVEVWSHFSQVIIDEAIDEWSKRLLACV